MAAILALYNDIGANFIKGNLIRRVGGQRVCYKDERHSSTLHLTQLAEY